MAQTLVTGPFGNTMLTTDDAPPEPQPNQAWVPPGMKGWDPVHEPSGPNPQGTGGPFWRMPS